MHKNTKKIVSSLAVSALLACSIAIADEQPMSTESVKTGQTTTPESSQSHVEQNQVIQAEPQQSDSSKEAAKPDHLPSVFVKAVPLSSSVDVAADLTPGIVGLIMNIAHAANSVRQASSDKFKVFYLEDGWTLFQGRTCLFRAVEIDSAEEVVKIAAGDLVNVTRDSSRKWNINPVKQGEQAQKVDASHLCYESFQKQVAKK